MKTLDELREMDQATLLRYLDAEAENIISQANPGNQLKLRALQAKCDGIRARVKNPYYACELMSNMMLRSLEDLTTEMRRL